jgi:hypothetical protein
MQLLCMWRPSRSGLQSTMHVHDDVTCRFTYFTNFMGTPHAWFHTVLGYVHDEHVMHDSGYACRLLEPKLLATARAETKAQHTAAFALLPDSLAAQRSSEVARGVTAKPLYLEPGMCMPGPVCLQLFVCCLSP